MIYVAAYESDRLGGGWSFMDNFVKGMGELITQDYQAADIFFICSPSMVQRDDVQKAKDDGKKIVLRIDNAVRNSRNRNTGMSRMYDFAQWADLVIFQSTWGESYLNEFLHVEKKSTVILNGVDTSVFYPGNVTDDTYLYSRFNRDETKNFEVARYWYSREIGDKFSPPLRNPMLYIVGQFSEELRNGNFDFYNNEPYKFLGALNQEAMANLYRNCKNLIYTYYNDACSNTLIEALLSGCRIVGDNYYLTTGGSKEIMDCFKKKGRDYFSLERMVEEYKKAMQI